MVFICRSEILQGDKVILVEKDNYLLELCRCIVLNRVCARPLQSLLEWS
jgi:hypothetical protein